MPDANDAHKLLTEQIVRWAYEAAEQHGIGTPLTQEDFIRRYEALERGLPAEDEFIALLSWLGRCQLVHKLEQDQYPLVSRESYQVPDLFAAFDFGDRKIPALIEVKTTQKDSFKWSQKYFGKLKRYADLVNLPLLIAWKCRLASWVFWTLFSSDAFLRPHTSYKMTLGVAVAENLLGQLAGDFFIDIQAGVGLQFRVDLIGDEQDWQKMQEAGQYFGKADVFWTNGPGSRLDATQLSPALQPILSCVPPLAESSRQDTDSAVVQSYRFSESYPLFAQHILLIWLTGSLASEGERIGWRDIVKLNKLPIPAREIEAAIDEAVDQGIANFVFRQIPQTTPDFMK